MSMPKCYRWGCENPGVEKYARVDTVSHLSPVCPEHQYRSKRKSFHVLSAAECATLTEEDIAWYATETELGEQAVREQVASCKAIVEDLGTTSRTPSAVAKSDLRKKIWGAMVASDPVLSDEEVVKAVEQTVERYCAQYGVQRVKGVGIKRGDRAEARDRV